MDVGDAVRLGRASPDCPLAVPQAYEMDGGLASVSECVDGEPRRPLLLLELRVPPPSRLYAARQWARVPMCLGTATGLPAPTLGRYGCMGGAGLFDYAGRFTCARVGRRGPGFASCCSGLCACPSTCDGAPSVQLARTPAWACRCAACHVPSNNSSFSHAPGR